MLTDLRLSTTLNPIDIIEIQLERLSRKRMMILEIGSFRGNCIQEILDRCKPGRVIGIEPCPKNAAYLRERFKDVSVVEIHQIAISDRNGTQKFFVADHPKYEGNLSSESNSLHPQFVGEKSWATSVQEIEVEVQTLDQFCLEMSIPRIDLLKINCEGGEFQIFSPKNPFFLDRVNVIDIVIHGKSPKFLTKKYCDKKRKINIILVERGFRIVYGYDLSKSTRFPVEHMHQIWVKDGKR